MTLKPSAHNPLWMLQPAGQRYPYPAGRSCADCDHKLSRYTPGPWCLACTPKHDLERTLGLEAAA